MGVGAGGPLLLSECLLSVAWCLWSWYPVNRPVLSQITRPLLGSLQSAYWANWSVDDTLNMEQPSMLQHLHTLGANYWSRLWDLVHFSMKSLQTVKYRRVLLIFFGGGAVLKRPEMSSLQSNKMMIFSFFFNTSFGYDKNEKAPQPSVPHVQSTFCHCKVG